MQGNHETYHETSIDTNGNTQGHKHERHLAARPDSKHTGPETKEGTGAVEHRQNQWDHEDIEVRETGFDQMPHDYAAHGVGIDEADVQQEGDQMVLQDMRLQIQIRRDEDPDSNDRQEAIQGLEGVLTAFSPGLHDMKDTRTGGEEEDQRAIEQVPLRKVHAVDRLGQPVQLGQANGLQHRTVPKAPAAFVGCKREHQAEGQHSFHGAGDDAQSQDLSVVFIPGLHVKGQGCWKPQSIHILDSNTEKAMHVHPNIANTVNHD